MFNSRGLIEHIGACIILNIIESAMVCSKIINARDPSVCKPYAQYDPGLEK